ncbi:hypothetical protein FA13DRAFT_1779157 [Coprinellus micaceus]|uniref:DUF6535 domain-containing protein n=1 Tax=Coprinellus micaceus TaxID=71717 RepID=A0A4Y7SID1_COPMI|nr:hypothetical protein FA13DRAFT_1779157 [Coprinellus micaceus]
MVHCFLVTSLIHSLSTAALCILCLQWLREHQRQPSGLGSPKEMFPLRAHRNRLMDIWCMLILVGTLPAFLVISLFCFLVALLTMYPPSSMLRAWTKSGRLFGSAPPGSSLPSNTFILNLEDWGQLDKKELESSRDPRLPMVWHHIRARPGGNSSDGWMPREDHRGFTGQATEQCESTRGSGSGKADMAALERRQLEEPLDHARGGIAVQWPLELARDVAVATCIDYATRVQESLIPFRVAYKIPTESCHVTCFGESQLPLTGQRVWHGEGEGREREVQHGRGCIQKDQQYRVTLDHLHSFAELKRSTRLLLHLDLEDADLGPQVGWCHKGYGGIGEEFTNYAGGDSGGCGETLNSTPSLYHHLRDGRYLRWPMERGQNNVDYGFTATRDLVGSPSGSS